MIPPTVRQTHNCKRKKEAQRPNLIKGEKNILPTLSSLHHGRILFLEPFVQPSRPLEVLVHTAQYTTLLTGRKRLGGEIGDAVVEAALNEFRVHLYSRY